MKLPSSVWFLAPHALSSACFGAAFLWISIVQTNRSDPDLILGVAGLAALAAALASSIAASGLALFRGGVRHRWPWLLAHLGGLALAAALADDWIAAHLA